MAATALGSNLALFGQMGASYTGDPAILSLPLSLACM